MIKNIKTIFTIATLFVSIVIVYAGQAQAAQINFDLLKSTPVGSWQLREDMTIDHKGRQSIIQIRSSLLSSEVRGGQKYFWIEMVMDSFKVKKNGDRKKDGDQMVMKTLVAESS